MKTIEKYLIKPEATVLEAMSVIDGNGKGIAFVCCGKKITAVVTDGDVRRFIIHGGNLSANVMNAANTDFRFVTESEIVNPEMIERIKLHFKAVPVLDKAGNLHSILFADDAAADASEQLNIPVVIMAGGKGTRLYPFTKVLPKPLIPIGDMPITMHIMQHFAKFGCNVFTMIVNHQKELIKAYYSDSEIPYTIDFADETTPLGTAGGLKLLEGKMNETFFLTNCDILIDADYAKIYQYHKETKNLITMVCAAKNVTIPYGTIHLNAEGRIEKMVEKPTMSYLVNTGVYIIEPEVLSMIPDNTFIHMPDVVQKCMEDGKNVGVFPIGENQWSDMGEISEMKKMEEKLFPGLDK